MTHEAKIERTECDFGCLDFAHAPNPASAVLRGCQMFDSTCQVRIAQTSIAQTVHGRIRGAVERLAENDGLPITWCPHCAEAEANPWPPTDSEGEE